MPFPTHIQFYLNENIITQEQAETLSELEIRALNTEYAREKFVNGIEQVSIYASGTVTQSFSGKEVASLFLDCPAEERAGGMQLFIGVQAAIDENILSMEQAVSLPMNKIFLLSSPLFRALIASGEAGFDAESGVVTIQQRPITEMKILAGMFNQLQELQTYIEQNARSQELTHNITFQKIASYSQYKQLFIDGDLALDELLDLTMEQWESINRFKDLVRHSFGKSTMSVSETPVVSGISEEEGRVILGVLMKEEQIPERIHGMVKNHIISKEDMLDFPDIGMLYQPLCSLIVNGKVSITEVKSLTDKQKAYLSGYNAHDLIMAGIATPAQIYQLTPGRLRQLECLELGAAKEEDVFNLLGDGVATFSGRFFQDKHRSISLLPELAPVSSSNLK